MEVLDVPPTVIPDIASESDVSFLVLHFHICFTVFSAIVTIFLLKAWLYRTISRVFAIFEIQLGPRLIRNWCRTVFSFRHSLQRFGTFGGYHQVFSENETVAEYHDDYEDIEMTYHHATTPTAHLIPEELGNDTAGQPSIGVLFQREVRSLSADIASTFEAHPQGISRAMLGETTPVEGYDSESITSSKLLPQLNPENVNIGYSELDQDNNPRDLERNIITRHHGGVLPNMKEHNEMVFSIEYILSPFIDMIVEWIMPVTDGKME